MGGSGSAQWTGGWQGPGGAPSLRGSFLGAWWTLGGLRPFFFSLCFLGLHLQLVEVPRLGVESELQVPVYATATAMPDPLYLQRTPQLRAMPDP